MKLVFSLIGILLFSLAADAQKVRFLKPATEPTPTHLFAPERIDTAEIVYVTKTGLKKGHVITTTAKCTYDYYEQSVGETFIMMQRFAGEDYIPLKPADLLGWRLVASVWVNR
ncbi:MAG: hypothetical protein JNM22_01795 [Saprospiraceae bacterium]|nr:hypothetical protein [Saprospiraceae bacterium]